MANGDLEQVAIGGGRDGRRLESINWCLRLLRLSICVFWSNGFLGGQENKRYQEEWTPYQTISQQQQLERRFAKVHRSARFDVDLLDREKWISIGANLDDGIEDDNGNEGNFRRLKKGYATLRKSFKCRQQMEGFRESSDTQDLSTKTKGARKILGLIKGLRQVGGVSELQHSDQMDGSFKILSPLTAGTTTTTTIATTTNSTTLAAGRPKTDGEREIELRLRRSKRRVLQSASYVSPNSESACEGLDLDKIEAIKRDNLRLTLRAQKMYIAVTGEPLSSSETAKTTTTTTPSRESLGGDDDYLSGQLNVEQNGEANREQPCRCLYGELGGVDAKQAAVVAQQVNEWPASGECVAQAADDCSTKPSLAADSEELARQSPGQLLLVVEEESNQNDHLDGRHKQQQQQQQHQQPPSSSQSNSTTVIRVQVSGQSSDSHLDGTGCVKLATERENEQPLVEVEDKRLNEATQGQLQATTISDDELRCERVARRREQIMLSLNENALWRSQMLAEFRGNNNNPRKNNNNNINYCNEKHRQRDQATEEPRVHLVRDDQKRERISQQTYQHRHHQRCISMGPEEHLYASIYGQFDTPSPQVISYAEENHWVEDYEQVERELFEKQLNSRHDDRLKNVNNITREDDGDVYQEVPEVAALGASLYSTGPPKSKRSFFAKLKQLITRPTKQQSDRWSPNDQNNDQPPVGYLFDRRFKSARWLPEKSVDASLSKSAQNLFTGSTHHHHHLSLSRKSINLAHLERSGAFRESNYLRGGNDDDDDDDEECHRRFKLVSKSRFNGFLTLVRRPNKSRNHQNNSKSVGRGRNVLMSASQIFVNTKDEKTTKHNSPNSSVIDHHRQRNYGSADSLPSEDSGLSCGNLQASSSSEEAYGPLQRSGSRIRVRDNLYSCSPLQNMAGTKSRRCTTNSHLNDGYYRRFDQPIESGKQSRLYDREQLIVGMARAKVDCNPCAYDKEALEFSKGELIEILERNQTGTWIGKCRDRIGHFKFVNVSEIEDNDEDDGEADVRSERGSTDFVGAERSAHQGEEPVTGRMSDRGGFVTKLEISSSNLEPKEGVINKRKLGLLPPLVVTEVNRRSISLVELGETASACGEKENVNNTLQMQIDRDHNVNYDARMKETNQDDSNLANLRKTDYTMDRSDNIMNSSLEQLLYAIGLAGNVVSNDKMDLQATHRSAVNLRGPDVGESVGGNRCEPNNSHGLSDENEQLSYLNVLIRGGINDLSSFSAIDDCGELKQIGILDDEHQRRLLMAARIIRQASQAAQTDFVRNYLGNSTGTTGNSNCSRIATGGGQVKETSRDRDRDQGRQQTDQLTLIGHGERPAANVDDDNNEDKGNVYQLTKSKGSAVQFKRANSTRRPVTLQSRLQQDGCSDNSAEPIYVNLVNQHTIGNHQRATPLASPVKSIITGHQIADRLDRERQCLQSELIGELSTSSRHQHQLRQPSRWIKPTTHINRPTRVLPPPRPHRTSENRLSSGRLLVERNQSNELPRSHMNSRSAYDLRLDLSHFFS